MGDEGWGWGKGRGRGRGFWCRPGLRSLRRWSVINHTFSLKGGIRHKNIEFNLHTDD
jgi:hypothetical protein